jgi:iron complex transport system ATP-binding protein
MEKGTTVLEAKNLSIGYTANKQVTTVAAAINLSLKTGSLTALIGANGIGKSTLLRTLTGIQKPLDGQVNLEHKNISDYSAAALAQHLSIVLTESLPASNLTVYELVALGRQPFTNWLGNLSDEDKVKISEALQLTQTEHLAHKKHFEISDGQLQKVLIARALAQDTKLIVLDEPTTHLDFQHKASVLRLLKNLAAESGKSILYSTHDLDLALQLSDELIVVTKNKVIQDTPEQLITDKIIDSLFDDPNIIFDPEKRSFIFR